MLSEKTTILVIDDEKAHANVLVEALEAVCDEAIAVYDADKAAELIQRQRFNVIITDLNLSDEKIDGLYLLDLARANSSSTEVILITAYATIDTCKEAIRRGAFDYLVKPIDIDQLRKMAEDAMQKTLFSFSAQPYMAVDDSGFIFDGVKGSSPAMQHIFTVLGKVAPTNINVLIEGQSGSGKELLAKAIHDNSLRTGKAYRPINCAGLTESLLESELFGHAKGAFTGATDARKGLFEIADKGTLFLDEIGDMPMVMQSKLLRVLEDGIVTPVGSNKSTVVDVRVISATNHRLAELVEQKKFRQDLYFRIKGVSVTVPSLSQRPKDIPELVDYFIAQACEEIGIPQKSITKNAKHILQGFSWPGNIRQLCNCIRAMVVMCDSDVMDIKDLPPEIYRLRQLSGTVTAAQNLGGISLNEIEKQAIIDTLIKVDNNREKAAKLLGIGERTLYRKIKEYSIQ